MLIPLKAGRKQMKPHLGEDLRNKQNLRLGFGFSWQLSCIWCFWNPQISNAPLLFYLKFCSARGNPPLHLPVLLSRPLLLDLLTLEGSLPFPCFFPRNFNQLWLQSASAGWGWGHKHAPNKSCCFHLKSTTVLGNLLSKPTFAWYLY